jgi:simple sugar transport system ATP-binding protein
VVTNPLLELRGITKEFPGTMAVKEVSLTAYEGEVLCLLGHNGAGKSTLIKILSGDHKPSAGEIFVDGRPLVLEGPHAARAAGIATVHQSIGTLPLMSVARNFFLGAEPTVGWGPFRFLDMKTANRVAVEEIRRIGIARVAANQTVGTLSGGERQALAIARAMYFGARILILDEPTSNLGVRETRTVLDLLESVRERGVAVIVVTHNVYEAAKIGDRFVVLVHGLLSAQFRRGERSPEEIAELMAGGETLDELRVDADPAGDAGRISEQGNQETRRVG